MTIAGQGDWQSLWVPSASQPFAHHQHGSGPDWSIAADAPPRVSLHPWHATALWPLPPSPPSMCKALRTPPLLGNVLRLPFQSLVPPTPVSTFRAVPVVR